MYLSCGQAYRRVCPRHQFILPRLAPNAQVYSKRIIEMGEKEKLMVQETNSGFGGAVLQVHHP